jgi:photosystem II stability/assembly factor-like uncharacterized protein
VQTGWVVGTAGTLLYTTDGGSSWATQGSIGPSVHLYAVQVAEVKTVNESTTFLQRDEVRPRTHLPGLNSFKSTTLTPLSRSQDDVWVNVTTVSSQVVTTVYAAGTADTVLKSVNDGAAWSALPLPTRGMAVFALSFISTTSGWAVGHDSQVAPQ